MEWLLEISVGIVMLGIGHIVFELRALRKKVSNGLTTQVARIDERVKVLWEDRKK